MSPRMRDAIQAFTAVVVALIASGGMVWATIIAGRTKRTERNANGTVARLIEANRKLTETLADYLNDDRDIGGERDRRP